MTEKKTRSAAMSVTGRPENKTIDSTASIPKVSEKGKSFRWNYHDSHGHMLGFVKRHDKPDGQKDVIPYFRRENGKWKAGAAEVPRPLYGLDKLDGESVFIVEGEKCAAALQSLDLCAVTSPGGAKAADKAGWEPLQCFETVYLLPDADEAGEGYIEAVASMLSAMPGDREILRVDLPDLPPDGGDVADWLSDRIPDWNGYDPVPEELKGDLRAEFLDAVKAHSGKIDLVRNALRGIPCIPLPEKKDVPPFDFDMAPGVLRGWIQDTAERFQCPPDFLAAAAVVQCAALLGRRVSITPKAHDKGWRVVPNLWGAVVGAPAAMKTPALMEALQVIKEIESDYARENEEALELYQRDLRISKQRQKAADDLIKKSLRNDPTAPVDGDRAVLLPDPPSLKRIFLNDATIEKLGEVLIDNPEGVLLFRDELVGALRSAERPGREDQRAFMLEGWAGDGAYTFDRIGRGTVRIPHVCFSLLGGIQPGPLLEYVEDAEENRAGADGLLQRFQILVWPDISKTWQHVDRPADEDAQENAFRAMYQLLDARGDLVFDAEAQQVFNDWWIRFENDLRRMDAAEAFISHLAKYRSMVPSLAAIFHLLENNDAMAISADAVRMAVTWAGYLRQHAARLYSAIGQDEHDPARRLLERLDDLPDPFTARDVYRNEWSGLHREDAEDAIRILEEYNHLEPIRQNTGGRPTIQYKKVKPQGAEMN
jgi:tetratricopeptide (TPR) repeat protein